MREKTTRKLYQKGRLSRASSSVLMKKATKTVKLIPNLLESERCESLFFLITKTLNIQISEKKGNWWEQEIKLSQLKHTKGSFLTKRESIAGILCLFSFSIVLRAPAGIFEGSKTALLKWIWWFPSLMFECSQYIWKGKCSVKDKKKNRLLRIRNFDKLLKVNITLKETWKLKKICGYQEILFY